MPTVQIPNNWTPRPYQLDALRAFDNGLRRQSLIWHRRAGKDSYSLQLGAIQAHQLPGTYWHLFPLQVQARRAIWHGIGASGVKFLEQSLPLSVRTTTRQQEMMIELKCGSTFQMAGSDSYDSLVGSNCRGVIFSEWALCDPRAWDYIRPIIRENDGWAVFITTYRGKNHAYKMHKRALKDPDWYASTLTVDDTRRGNGSRVLTKKDIDAERREGMSEAMIQQEYYCSPMASFEGAYWGDAMRKLVTDGRLTNVAHVADVPVSAAFDLGMDDHMAAIFIQEVGNEVRIIGSRSWRFTPIPEVCADMAKLPFPVRHVHLPHDAMVTGMNSGKTRERVFRDFGYTTEVVASPPGSKQPGIEAARNLLAQTWIDEAANELLFEAFMGYRTEESNEPGVFRLTPAHTWESHYADSFQVYAKSRRERLGQQGPLNYDARDQEAKLYG